MRRRMSWAPTTLVTAVVALALSWVPAPAAGAEAPSTREVAYRGAMFTVPTSWAVVDLEADPTQCVRFDVPAVYLGHEGPAPRCPARVVGRGDGLQVEPADASTKERSAPAKVSTKINGEAAVVDRATSVSGETRAVLSKLQLLVTVSHGPANSVADRVLNSLRRAPNQPASAAPNAATPNAAAPKAATVPAASRGARVYTGEGFDTCAAPAETTMNAWLASPYRSVGIYIGGISRGCAQPNLTASWVRNQANQGWSLVPIYVGHQAPCSTYINVIDPANAYLQGLLSADDAVANATSLGLAPGSPIYFDMESYDTTAPGCSLAVLTFLNGWTAKLHTLGFTSGVYSSAATGVTDLVLNYNNPQFNRPDNIWFARWNSVHSVSPDFYLPTGYWEPHRRLHQYIGGHDETWGGVTVNIDANYDDGTAVGGYPGYALDGWGGVHPFGGAPALSGASYVPGQDIHRGVVLRPGGLGGYVLDNWGGIHPFGNAPFVYGTGYWPRQDVARAIALNPCDPSGTSGYVLDFWGGVHQFGGAPDVTVTGYWQGWDIARSLSMTCKQGVPAGYVLDGWGGLHPVGPAAPAVGAAFWNGWDIAVAVALIGPSSGYTLDGFGGVHPFGGAPALTISAYWSGTRMAKGLAVVRSNPSPGGYVVDTNGGIHWFGSTNPQDSATFSGAIARGVVLGV